MRPRTSSTPVKTRSGPGFWSVVGKGYLGAAHLMGRFVRAFSTEKLADSDRRDGAPFFVFFLSVLGELFALFFRTLRKPQFN